MLRSSALRLLSAGFVAPLVGCANDNTMVVPHVDPNSKSSSLTTFGAQIYGADDIAQSLALIAQCGGKLVRIGSGGDPLEFERLDVLFPAAAQLGMRVILLTGTSPQPVPVDAYARDFVGFQQRYAAYDPIWEIWNEPNLAAYWGAAPNVDDYARLAIAVGQALRSAGATEIWSGGTSGIDLAWIRGLVQAGVFSTLTGCGVHSYEYPGGALDHYMLARGLLPPGIQLHTTETGVPTDHDQADFLTDMWYLHRQLSLPTMIWVEFRDGSAGKSGPDSFPYGLVTAAYQPKNSYRAAQGLVSA